MDVIKDFALRRENTMLHSIFTYHVNGNEDWDSVLEAYRSAVNHFDGLVSSLTEGVWCYTTYPITDFIKFHIAFNLND